MYIVLAGKLIAVIGDEDTVTGFLLAGIGHRTTEGANFLVVKPGESRMRTRRIMIHVLMTNEDAALWNLNAETPVSIVEDCFNNISNRDDVGIILINQHVSRRMFLLSSDDRCMDGLLLRLDG